MSDQAMGLFLSACGAGGPFVLGVEEPGSTGVSWRVFDQPFIVVGRDPGADLRLDHAEVSRHHAYLQLIAGRLFCVDLQSTTGTRWGDESGLWGWVHAEPGVGIGPCRLRPREGWPEPRSSRRDDRSSVPVPISKSFVQPDLPEVSVEILSASVGSPTWRVSRALVLIGSSTACRIRLEGGGVAEVHASLLRTPSGVFAVDLLAKGGIRVNGEPVRYARIGEDDEIAVGRHRIRVRCRPPGARGGQSLASIRRGPGGPGLASKSEGRPVPPAGVQDARAGNAQGPSAMGTEVVSLVRSMLNEFAQTQQRMADRFQESMMLVVQAFAASHGEQTALIREELARIREIAEEQGPPPSLAGEMAPSVASSHSLRLVSAEPCDSIDGLHPRADAPSSAKGRDETVPDLRAMAPGGPAGSGGLAATRIEESQDHRPVPPLSADLHAQIAVRLAAIHDERQGRWQKLMRSLLG